MLLLQDLLQHVRTEATLRILWYAVRQIQGSVCHLYNDHGGSTLIWTLQPVTLLLPFKSSATINLLS